MHADARGAEIDPLGGLLGDEGLRALVELEGTGDGTPPVVWMPFSASTGSQ